MSDDPIHALARANPFPNDGPVDVPSMTFAPKPGHVSGAWVQRCVVVASLALGASLGWGLISTIVEPAASIPNRCVVVGARVVVAKGVCIADSRP